ncbi:hypothetical protein, partial [Microcoleus sp. herbarium12]|uniref:hypothetical protein n=1 Tax=Microcoleus sp. herbarium12 TaxID=3055437 RepID=UPI002FD04BC8
MLEIEASTPKLTINTSIIPDIAENLQPNKYTNNSAALAPTNIIATQEKSSTNSSLQLLSENTPTLDKSPEKVATKADIDSFILNKNSTPTINSIAENPQTSTSKTDTITGDKAQPATHNNIPSESSICQTDKTAQTSLDNLLDSSIPDKEQKLIADATPETETKLAEKKVDTASITNPVETKTETSPVVETKKTAISEIPNSITTPTETKIENSPVTETKNSTVSEICNCATNPTEIKLEESPVVETKNPTISEIPNFVTTPADTKNEKSSVVETKNPTISEIPNSTATPTQTKTKNSPTTEAKNPTISEIPNSATNP